MDMSFPISSSERSPLCARLNEILDSRRGQLATLVIVFVLAVIVGLGSLGLVGIREKRVGACVADIVYEGNWLLPHLRDKLRLEKPPLPYWIMAAFAEIVGTLNEWTLRLPGAVAGLVILLVTMQLARKAGGARVGLLSSLFLATSQFFVAEVRQ